MTLRTEPQHLSHSRTTMTEIVLPTHTNAMGGVFGGQIMAWVDIAGAICAQRHTGMVCVTAGVDDLSFERSIKAGQFVKLDARITATFRTSVEVRVVVHGEDPLNDESWLCVEAYLTFVAVDTAGKPVPCPQLIRETPEDELYLADATARRQRRVSRRRG